MVMKSLESLEIHSLQSNSFWPRRAFNIKTATRLQGNLNSKTIEEEVQEEIHRCEVEETSEEMEEISEEAATITTTMAEEVSKTTEEIKTTMVVSTITATMVRTI
jgi:hypothetical protein